MQHSSLRDNWPELRSKLKQKYPQLKDHDLDFSFDSDRAVYEQLAALTGQDPEVIEKELDAWHKPGNTGTVGIP